MKQILRGLFATGGIFLFWIIGAPFTYAQATIPTIPPPVKVPNSPLIISAYSTEVTATIGGKVSASLPRYIEIYNTDTSAVAMDGWSLTIGFDQQGNDIVIDLSGPFYLRPHGYAVVSINDAVTSAVYSVEIARDMPYIVTSLQIGNVGYQPYVTDKLKQAPTAQELDATQSGYTTTVNKYHDDTRDTLYQTELYGEPPATFPLAPIEILPNAKKCAPNDNNIRCNDYVKFYNNTTNRVDFSGTRLRLGYKDQSVSVTNAIPLSGSVAPGEYITFATTASGSALSMTNAGGFVWLEDTYGLHSYDETIVEYPDASSVSHIGKSWAYDSNTGEWQWAIPTPFDANQFPAPVSTKASSISLLVPCRPDQYRSTETNRCRLIASTTSTLTPCKPNQYRSTETNRCRNLVSSAASTQKPCNANQFRNPETGRCKLLASTATNLKPCQPGWERNSETNRCRKVKVSASEVQGYSVKNLPVEKDSYTSWWIASGIGVLILGRLIWEWRTEIQSGFWRLLHLHNK